MRKKTADVLKLWKMSDLTSPVSSGTPLVSSGTMLGDYAIVSQGKCELCTECDRGQHNPDCNKWELKIEPKGSCQTCKSKCDGSGQFLWHA